MKALMLIRHREGRTEVFIEPGTWGTRGLPYPFRNIYHAQSKIRTDGWAYEINEYRLEWMNYEDNN